MKQCRFNETKINLNSNVKFIGSEPKKYDSVHMTEPQVDVFLLIIIEDVGEYNFNI